MSTYRNTADRRNLTTLPDGVLIIATDDVRDDLAFTPRPEDRAAIALDVLGEVENPSSWEDAKGCIDWNESDADLLFIAYRNLKALAIRRERATKAEAEAKEAEAQLDREAITLWLSYEGKGRSSDWGRHVSASGRNWWRNVARKARELHEGAGK